MVRATAVAHRLAHAADQLIDDRQHAALVGDAAFDAFRGPACRPCSPRPGSSGRPSLRPSRPANPCRGRTCSCGPGTGSTSPGASSVPANIEPIMTVCAPAASALEMSPEIADAAVGDARHARALQRFGHVRDRGDLRHAHAGHDTGRADRARADADLHCVGALFDQRARGGGRGDVAADDVDVRIRSS